MVVPAAVWLFCALATVDAAVEGSARYALRVAPLMAAVAWSAWQMLASPSLVVHGAGIRIVNPLRVHEIPFGALLEVRVRGLTSVGVRHESGGARVITSWNAPGLPRRATAPMAPVGPVVERFRGSWERTHVDDGTAVVTTSWRWRSTSVLLGLILLNVAIWLW
jgi:hypothetical protein